MKRLEWSGEPEFALESVNFQCAVGDYSKRDLALVGPQHLHLRGVARFAAIHIGRRWRGRLQRTMQKPQRAWRKIPFVCVLALLLGSVAEHAHAAIDDGVNAIRARGCDGKPGVRKALRPNRELDAVAKEWSKGGRLRDAFPRTDYRMVNSASMRVAGAPDERALLGVLEQNYCDSIVDPSLSEIGVHRRGDGVWIVLAEPFAAPSAKDASRVAREVLQLVNAARAKARKCGSRSFPAVAPLKASSVLDQAALKHAKDMARHSLFEHRGSDGSTPAQRATAAGYRWRTVAENIAAGARDSETVVRGWLDSPGHCVNIMSPQYSEMGLAFAVDPKSEAGIYWAQVFGSPR